MDPFAVIPAVDVIDEAELAYIRSERAGMRLDSILCVECPDPGLCGAEGECMKGEAPGC